MVSHILGLNDYRETIMEMAHPNGAKKVCYTHLDIPLTALEDFAEKGKTDPMFKVLAEIIRGARRSLVRGSRELSA